ncbi:MAG: hypothetical protein K8T89_12150, partial [Planctomycetes bacterium]|nr:hypothetical protein [Planctomycetota bacterium]
MNLSRTATPRSWASLLPISIAALMLSICVGDAKAQTYTWNQPGSGNWSSAVWIGGTPASGSTTILNFGGTTSYTATDNIAGIFTLNQLNFDGTGAGTTITIDLGGTATGLNFGGISPVLDIAATNVANITISAATSLSASTVFTNDGSGFLNFTGPIAAGTNSFTVNGSGSGNTSISGGITFTGASSIINSSTGTGATTITNITLGGATTITNNAPTALRLRGLINAGANNIVFNGTGAGGVNGLNSILRLTGNSNITNSGTGDVSLGILLLSGSTTFTNSGASNFTLSSTIFAGMGRSSGSPIALVNNGSGTMTLSGVTNFLVPYGNVVSVGGTGSGNTIVSGTINFGGNGLIVNNGTGTGVTLMGAITTLNLAGPMTVVTNNNNNANSLTILGSITIAATNASFIFNG